MRGPPDSPQAPPLQPSPSPPHLSPMLPGSRELRWDLSHVPVMLGGSQGHSRAQVSLCRVASCKRYGRGWGDHVSSSLKSASPVWHAPGALWLRAGVRLWMERWPPQQRPRSLCAHLAGSTVRSAMPARAWHSQVLASVFPRAGGLHRF